MTMKDKIEQMRWMTKASSEMIDDINKIFTDKINSLPDTEDAIFFMLAIKECLILTLACDYLNHFVEDKREFILNSLKDGLDKAFLMVAAANDEQE